MEKTHNKHRSIKQYHKCIHCSKLTPNGVNQWKIAKYLMRNGETDSRKFRKMLNVSRCSVSMTIKTMVDIGLVKRRYQTTKGTPGIRCMVSLI